MSRLLAAILSSHSLRQPLQYQKPAADIAAVAVRLELGDFNSTIACGDSAFHSNRRLLISHAADAPELR
jgi:hypothetical protein